VINPAITIIVAIQYATKGQMDSLINCWAWLLGDVIGCVAATFFYDKLYEPIINQLR
jgi:glycerol uptake facilitator-like aquaporin